MNAPVPAASPVWVRELDPERGQFRMDAAISKLRDEITAVAMQRHRGSSRDLSMVIAKLDEAESWAIRYGLADATLVLVPRADVLQKAFPVATDTTDESKVPTGGSDARL